MGATQPLGASVVRNDQEQTTQLLKLIRGLLSGKQERDLLGMIKSDKELAHRYEILKTLGAMKSELNASSLTAALKNLSGTLFKDFVRGKQNPKKRTGVTVYDSQDIPLPAGVRPATVDTRRLRYRLLSGDLEISLYPIAYDTYELIGRLSRPEGVHDMTVGLISGRRRLSTTTDKFGLFRFEKMPSGKSCLQITKAEETIGTIDLDL